VKKTTKHFDQCGSHNDKNTLDTCTHSLDNVKTVSKNVPKQLRKTVKAQGLSWTMKTAFPNPKTENKRRKKGNHYSA